MPAIPNSRRVSYSPAWRNRPLAIRPERDRRNGFGAKSPAQAAGELSLVDTARMPVFLFCQIAGKGINDISGIAEGASDGRRLAIDRDIKKAGFEQVAPSRLTNHAPSLPPSGLTVMLPQRKQRQQRQEETACANRHPPVTSRRRRRRHHRRRKTRRRSKSRRTRCSASASMTTWSTPWTRRNCRYRATGCYG